jgi:hypothetical protein
MIMRRSLAILACGFFLTSSSRGEEYLPDGSPLSGNGGLIIMRRGNDTIVSFGGAFLPRKVKVTTPTPEGPIVTRFTMPSILKSPTTPPFPPLLQGPPSAPLPPSAPAFLQVSIPDAYGLIYIEDQLVHRKDASGLLQSPPLQPGRAYPLRVRAVFAAGDKLLIEDKQVLLRAGESTTVTFDGSRAVAVPLPRSTAPVVRAAGKGE